MERYGCLVIGIIIALIILTVTVYYWSGWLNRPVGRLTNPQAQTLTLPLAPEDRGALPECARLESARPESAHIDGPGWPFRRLV